MTDPIEQLVRRGLTELVRDKPPLGPIDLEAVTAARSRRGTGSPHRATTRWLLAAAVLVLVAGLGVAGLLSLPQGPRQVTTAEPQQGPGQLTGIRWLATRIGDQPARPDREGVVPFLIFESADRVRGNHVCNRLTASYRLDGDRLRFSGGMVTEIACRDSAAIERQAQAYGDALNATALVRRNGATLTLLDSAGGTLLVFRAASAPDPSEPVMIRLRNGTALDLVRVRASFPDGSTIDYGPVKTGQSTDYRHVAGAYTYTDLRIRTADGQELVFHSSEDSREAALAPGRYTFVLQIIGEGGKRQVDLRLEADQ